MLVMGGHRGLGHLHEPVRGRPAGRHAGAHPRRLGASAGSWPLAGAFVYAELASLRPTVGGQYAYLREAFSPRVAFLYGWVLLLVTQSGGMAAVAVTFARYLGELVRAAAARGASSPCWRSPRSPPSTASACAPGSDVQSLLMVLKTVAILGLVATGFVAFGGERVTLRPVLDRPPSFGLVAAIGRVARARALRLRRLADLGLRDGGAAPARARHAAGAAARRRRRRRPLPLGQPGLPAGARAPTASPRAARRPPT